MKKEEKLGKEGALKSDVDWISRDKCVDRSNYVDSWCLLEKKQRDEPH